MLQGARLGRDAGARQCRRVSPRRRAELPDRAAPTRAGGQGESDEGGGEENRWVHGTTPKADHANEHSQFDAIAVPGLVREIGAITADGGNDSPPPTCPGN